jgi:aminopeptidase N
LIHRTGFAALLTTATLVLACGTALAGNGAPGVGDAILPHAGNGGYDVANYDVQLHYEPKSTKLRATNAITATSTMELDRFNLDWRAKKLQIDSITVDGTAAGFKAKAPELVVTPAEPIADGAGFDVVVNYHGRPKPVNGPVDGAGQIGWVPTKDGAWVANEPDGAASWLPCNDHPSDKATLSMTIDVPARTAGISNGELLGHSKSGGRSIWSWRSDYPIATYLITATIGRFDIDRRPIDGLQSIVAIDKALPDGADAEIAPQDAQMRAEIEREIGPYPFDSTGAIIDDGPPGVYYALETQNRPIYNANTGGRYSPPVHIVVAHETSHEWFGNSVTPDRWQDIWLNEGFASWMERLWDRSIATNPNAAKREFDRIFDFYYRSAPSHMKDADFKRYWRLAPGNVDSRSELFDGAVYIRGFMTLQALSYEIGEDRLFELLHRWVTENAYGNVTTKQFIALAEDVSGQNLDKLFDKWLYTSGQPKRWWSPGKRPDVLDDHGKGRAAASGGGAFEPLSMDGLASLSTTGRDAR